MLNKRKYNGNYFGIQSFLPTFAQKLFTLNFTIYHFNK